MDRIIFKDDVFEESYSLNPVGIFGDEVEDWTMEEFYGSYCDKVYMEAEVNLDTPLAKFIAMLMDKSPTFEKWIVNKANYKELKKKNLRRVAPVISMIADELGPLQTDSLFFADLKLRLSIVQGAIVAASIIKLCTEDIMFKKKWGRFPADLKSFYEYAFKMPKELTKEDITKFRAELKKLRKDTKWFATGRAGKEFITPKERKMLELMDEQLRDLLIWKMIPKDVEGQKNRRVHDRLKQFVETSFELMESVHSEMIDSKTKNQMKEALK